MEHMFACPEDLGYITHPGPLFDFQSPPLRRAHAISGQLQVSCFLVGDDEAASSHLP